LRWSPNPLRLAECAEPTYPARPRLRRYAESIESVYVIGGGTIYAEALKMPDLCERVYLTEVAPAAAISSTAAPRPLQEVNGVIPSAAAAVPAADCGAGGASSPFGCDVFFPDMGEGEWMQTAASAVRDESLLQYRFLTFEPKGRASNLAVRGRHEEMQYLDMVREVLDHGSSRPDRTGVGTLGKFGVQMRFSLRDSFPLLTTKRVFWRGVAEELLW
jgi:dihydrofolate reductase/thymidylate synthase